MTALGPAKTEKIRVGAPGLVPVLQAISSGAGLQFQTNGNGQASSKVIDRLAVRIRYSNV